MNIRRVGNAMTTLAVAAKVNRTDLGSMMCEERWLTGLKSWGLSLVQRGKPDLYMPLPLPMIPNKCLTKVPCLARL